MTRLVGSSRSLSSSPSSKHIRGSTSRSNPLLVPTTTLFSLAHRRNVVTALLGCFCLFLISSESNFTTREALAEQNKVEAEQVATSPAPPPDADHLAASLATQRPASTSTTKKLVQEVAAELQETVDTGDSESLDNGDDDDDDNDEYASADDHDTSSSSDASSTFLCTSSVLMSCFVSRLLVGAVFLKRATKNPPVSLSCERHRMHFSK